MPMKDYLTKEKLDEIERISIPLDKEKYGFNYIRDEEADKLDNNTIFNVIVKTNFFRAFEFKKNWKEIKIAKKDGELYLIQIDNRIEDINKKRTIFLIEPSFYPELSEHIRSITNFISPDQYQKLERRLRSDYECCFDEIPCIDTILGMNKNKGTDDNIIEYSCDFIFQEGNFIQKNEVKVNLYKKLLMRFNLPEEKEQNLTVEVEIRDTKTDEKIYYKLYDEKVTRSFGLRQQINADDNELEKALGKILPIYGDAI